MCVKIDEGGLGCGELQEPTKKQEVKYLHFTQFQTHREKKPLKWWWWEFA